ncbi:MAG: HAD-IIIC family phosphatase, partial [Acidobacteria bacterium]|nr:HAD-IIIC family phosphatase [Acidobacteriota bacterium]
MSIETTPPVNESSGPYRIAIAASFTAEPLAPVLAFWAAHLGTAFAVRFAAYNQILQTILDPAGEFASNPHGLNTVLLRLEDLGQFAGGAGRDELRANLDHLAHALHDTAATGVPLLVFICPSSAFFEANHAGLEAETVNRVAAALAGNAHARLIPPDQLAGLYPVPEIHDPEGERLGRIPYTEAYFAALGTAIARHADSLQRPPYKVIVLDCDNTLWSGVCGEDGPAAVLIDPARRELHQRILDQRDAGMLLAMASKNNEEDVLETFRLHPESPLQPEHFTAWRLNWDSKADSLVSLSEELGLGLDSFIFIDDNAKECAEVSDALPEVLAVTLPEPIDGTGHLLRHLWAFDHPRTITEEDRLRSLSYRQSREFHLATRSAIDLEQFMASLGLDVRAGMATPDNLARVAQLTRRTNQFNFTTLRRGEAELRALLAAGCGCATFEVSDRFGDYGLVGIALYRVEDSLLDVDTLLLSCRALGRGAEHRMLNWLGHLAAERGAANVRLRLDYTAKNTPAQNFLNSLTGTNVELSGSGVIALAPAEYLINLQWRPPAGPQPDRAAPVRRPATDRTFSRYAALARTLATPEQVVAAMRAAHSLDTDEALS